MFENNTVFRDKNPPGASSTRRRNGFGDGVGVPQNRRKKTFLESTSLAGKLLPRSKYIILAY